VFNKNRKLINGLQQRIFGRESGVVLEHGARIDEHRARIDKLEQIAPAIGDLEQRISELQDGINKFTGKAAESLQVQRFDTHKSYSIEAEDLLVARIFSVLLKQHGPGSYLDIGAAHPIQHSNTFYFYERSWSGLCVEPNPQFYALYEALRPRDKALNIGVAGRSGLLRYHRFTEPLINGFFCRDVVDRHISSGETYLGNSEVPCLSVKDFLNTKIDAPVDFLSLDVELMDAEILKAWDWQVCRPKVICAEIHAPSIESMLECEVATVLKAAGYTAMSKGWLSTIFVDGKLL
jgi:FkbM family methyltransferase